MLRQIIRKCVTLNILEHPRVKSIIVKHSILLPADQHPLIERNEYDFFGNIINPNAIRSVKQNGELAKFHNFIQRNNHLFLDDLFIDSLTQKSNITSIRNIFSFWDSPQVPSNVIENINSWRNHSNACKVLYDESSAYKYILKNIGADAANTFSKLPHPSAKSDFFRYAKVFTEGGIYLDADERLISSLSVLISLFDLLKIDRLLICDTASIQFYIQNHFIYCKSANDPFIKEVLINCIKNTERHKITNGTQIWNATGPGCVTRSFINCIENQMYIDSTGFITSSTFRRFFVNPPKDNVEWKNWRTFVA